MKAVWIVSLGLLYGAMLQADDYFTIQSASLVQQRFYAIRRLQEPIATFKKVYDQTARHQSALKRGPFVPLLDHQAQNLFYHAAVAQAVHQIITTKSLEPFDHLWDDFLSYKCMDDVRFVRETITLLLLLYNGLLITIAQDKITKNSSLNNNQLIIEHDGQQVLDKHDINKKSPLSSQQSELTELLASAHNLSNDLCKDIDCDVHDNVHALIMLLDNAENPEKNNFVIHNSMRFYHIQRMLRSMYVLSKQGYVFVLKEDLADSFQHECLKACVAQMKETQSLIPLFKVWKNFISYDFINDQLFVQDYIRLVIIIYAYLVYGNSVKDLSEHGLQNAPALNAAQLYQKIAALPIPELLIMLDDMSEQFAQVSEQYELLNPTLSWGEWFAQYWWASPAIVAKLFSAVAHHIETIKKLVYVFVQKSPLPSKE